ncbi:MAG: hypothetical protein WDO72_07650 [Pseudomonadota bacterium]
MNSRVQWLLARIALAAWLASWFLPVIDGYAGWAAFRAALEGPFRHSFPTAPEDAIPQVFSALTNVAFPIMFLMLARNRVQHAARFLQGASICLILDLYWLVQAARANELEKLLAGYYAWVGAFALLAAVGAISVVSNRRTSKTPTAGTPS